MILNLKMNVTPIFNIVIQFHFLNLCWLRYPYPIPDLIPKPTLIPIPIELEHEPLILDSHIPLLENECELQFYDLDQTYEPTPTLGESEVDLSFIP